jgi:prepilin-type N-terminal cleavage/methylation domain-containing protein
MLNKIKKSRNEGFTIIEVMIVLAIAALILLIVLLAVPALQRNSRNTALKNDASALVAGINEFKSNNDGANPTTITDTTVSSTVAAANSSVTIKLQGNTGVTSTATPTAGNLGYQIGQKCVGGANTRAVAVYYFVEQSSGGSVKCIDG